MLPQSRQAFSGFRQIIGPAPKSQPALCLVQKLGLPLNMLAMCCCRPVARVPNQECTRFSRRALPAASLDLGRCGTCRCFQAQAQDVDRTLNCAALSTAMPPAES